MSDFASQQDLIACYRSGQITEAQWQQHLSDTPGLKEAWSSEQRGGGAAKQSFGRKPLGGKAYGSIPHLPNSRMGPADHHCHPGQEAICTAKARDRHDRIIVTEKLDGACMAVAKIAGRIVPITRAGYHAEDGAYDHLRAFAPWVEANEARFQSVLIDGQRLAGEWLYLAHGTAYDLQHEPFVVFDLIEGNRRLPFDTMLAATRRAGFVTAHLIHDGGPIGVAAALERLGPHGRHGATETVEGAVWRVERRGQFDFIAKFVRPDKIDGKYLPNISGKSPVFLATLTQGAGDER